MKNVKELYYRFSLNKINLILIFISIILLFLIFNLWDFNIMSLDYNFDRGRYHMLYINDNISIISIISICLISVIIAIDTIGNNGRFDILFLSKITNKELIRIKLRNYIIMTIIYTSIIYLLMILVGTYRFEGFYFDIVLLKLWIAIIIVNIEVLLFSFLLIRLTKVGFSAIFVLILYFISSIVYDINKILGNVFLFHIDYSSNDFFKPGLFIGILFDVIVYKLIIKIFGNKEFKAI
ncbi:MAG: hypothetical protein ACI35W_02750 [Anaeroplasmataceae bacterium]